MTYEEFKKKRSKDPTYGMSSAYKKKMTERGHGVVSSLLSDYDTQTSAYVNSYNERQGKNTTQGGNIYRGDYAEWLSDREKGYNGITATAASLSSALDTYGWLFDAETVAGIRKSIADNEGTVKSIYDGAVEESNYYSQFADERDFVNRQNQASEYNRILNYDIAAGRKRLDAIQAYTESARDTGYNSVSDELWAEFGGKPLGRAATVDDLAKRYEEEKADYDKALAYQEPDFIYDDPDFKTHYYTGLQADANFVESEEASHMSQPQLDYYFYLYGKYGGKAAKDYKNLLMQYGISDKIAEEEEKRNEETRAWANDNKLLAAATSPLRGVVGALTAFGVAPLGQADDVARDYSNRNSQITAGITQDMSEFGAWATELGISAWDNIALGWNPATRLLRAGSTMTYAAGDALNRGVDEERAVGFGAFSALSELIGDKIGGQLFPGGGKATIGKKGFMRALLSKSGSGFAEEASTEILNIAYDTIVNGQYAEYTWDELKNSPDLIKEIGARVLGAGLGGAVFGTVFGSMDIRRTNKEANKSYKSEYGGVQSELVSAGLSAPTDSRAYELAQKNQAKLDAGKKLSGSAIRYQFNANEAAYRAGDVSTIKGAVAQTLQKYGETGDVDAISAAIAKEVSGEKLTKAEDNLIKSSLYGERVRNELNAENIKSGEYTSDWNANLGTERIGADVYNRGDNNNASEVTISYDAEGNLEYEGGTIPTEETADVATEGVATVPTASASAGDAVLQKIPEVIGREYSDTPSAEGTAVADTVSVSGDGKTTLISDGSSVTVAEVASVKDGKVSLKLDNGRVVDASDISYASRDDGLVYEMVADMTMSTANTFVSDYSVKTSDVPLSDYALAWKTAYEYGYRGFDEGEIYGDTTIADALIPTQARHAFAAGRADANAVRGTSKADVKRGAAEAVKTAETAVRTKAEAKAETEKKKAAEKGGKPKLSDSDPTVKSGRETGAKESDIELAVMLKKATGREIIFRKDKESLNGEYDGKNTVFVNPDGSDLVHTVLAHEIAHSVEGSKHYRKLVKAAKAVAEARGQKWDDILAEAWDTEAQAYKDNGQTFGDADAEYEAVAKVISSLFAEEADLRVFIEALDRPTIKVIYDAIGRVIKRIRSFLADRFKYMTDKKNYDAQYRRMQIELQRAERARAVFARALREPSGSGSGKVRYSYAGEKAKTADKLTLANAQAMLEAGVDPETVRKETGWFKGYEGEWKFEIDDSKMEIIKEVHLFNYLGDIIAHPELFAAYPELRDMPVNLKKLDSAYGEYVGTRRYTFGEIHINESLMNDRDKLKSTLIHEIQHAVQHYEGFTHGAAPEYWQSRRQDIEDTLKDGQKDLELWLNDIGIKDFVKSSMQEVFNKEKTLEQHWKDLQEFKDNSKYAKQIATREAELAEYQRQYDEITKGMTIYEQYLKTAGEIEARDAENRADLTAEQRKNTRPDIDQPDVVFAEGGNEGLSYIGDTSDGRRCYKSGFDESVDMDKREQIFKDRISMIFNLGAVELKTDVKKIVIKGDRFTAQKNLFGDKKNKPHEQEAKINSFYDLADILATSKYDPTATGPEASFINPQIPPKNDAHKGVKYWYKFRNNIVFDGIPYTVTFNIRDKGKNQYQYLIDFKEDKTPGRSNTAVKNLLRADQASYDPIISQPDGSVNSKNKNSRHSSTNGGHGTKPRNKAEELNRIKAQEMIAKGEAGEAVYDATGWYQDKFGNLVVDHEAPVYDTKSASEKLLSYAEHADAEAAARTAEALSLREDIRRAKSAIKSDSKATTKPDREYVKGLVNELIPDPADGKYPRRMREKYTDEILALYDRRDDVDSSGVHAMSEDKFEAEIARIVSEIQAEEVTYDDRVELASRMKAELRVPLYVSEIAKGDFVAGEGYAKTRQHYMGRLDLRSDRTKGTPIDVRYGELNEMFPEWFPENIENEADQLRRIMEVADDIFDESFTTGNIYTELSETAFAEDAERMKQSIREGYKKLKRIPKTFSDEILQMLESRERRTEEAHKAAMEKLLRKAEWEMAHELRAKEQLLAAVAEDYDKRLEEQRAYYEGREADRKKREADKKAAALKRRRDRGLFIDIEKEFAALKDGSFSSEMRKLYERQHQLVAELAPFENIDISKIENESIREYVKETREKLDNLNAYIRRVGQIQRKLLQKSWLEVLSRYNLAKWKDKRMGLSYQVETMRRNIEDISGGDELGREILKTAIDPIERHVAEGNKLKNALRARVEALHLDMKPKKGDILSESAFVQLYGEARDNIEMLKNGGGNAVDKNGLPMREGKTLEQWEGILNTILLENPGISRNADTMKRMDEAVKVFSEIYDKLIGMINSVRMLNGYEPVAYHHGYFPHFNNDTGADSTLTLLAKSLGIGEGELDGLPTSINGITRTFRPGIRYMANANQRSVYGIGQEYNGFRLNAGAVEGFDRYIEVAADIIYLTEDVQRLRALSNAIRYATTDKGIKERHDMIEARDDIDIAEKQSLIDTLYSGNQKYALRNFVVELEDYTNILAGKKSNADRDMEQKLGRSFYAFAKKIEGKVAANMVVLNPASWLTNFIPLTQGAAVMPTHMIVSSMYDTLRAVRKGDALAASSAFLTNRRGSEMISVRSASQVPARFMEAIDMFTSETLVRARVKQNVKRGMSYTDALAEADVFISKMMAGRSKGSMPTIFHQSNPLTKLFTQFQLEVKNQWSFFSKDMPAEARNNSNTKAEFVGRMIGMMLKYAVGAWLLDELYELLFGRRPAFDPIDIVNEAVGDITGYQLPSIGEMAKATFTDATWIDAVKTDKVGVGEAGKTFAANVGEQVPFVGGVLFDGGRIPISSALPSLSNVWDAMTNADAAPSKRARELADELSKPLYYTVLPFGGSMVKKAVEGTEALVRGGSYKLDKEGNDILQYPIYNDNAGDVAKNVATMLLSGKSATEGGREWVENGFDSLSAKETARYQALVKNGMSQRDAYEAVKLASDPKALYDVMMSGDTELISKARSGFKDEKAYEAALRTAITENDPRIMEAVKLQIAGDVSGRVAIQKEIIGEGHFKMGIVTAAVNNAVTSFNSKIRSAANAKLAGDSKEYQKIVNELVNEKGYSVETVSDAVGEDVTGLLEAPEETPEVETLYTAADIGTAFKSGDVKGAYAAITELVSVKTANYIAEGKTPKEAEKSAKSSVKAQVTKSFKEDYKAAYADNDREEMERIEEIIFGTGLYEKKSQVRSLLRDWKDEYDEEDD